MKKFFLISLYIFVGVLGLYGAYKIIIILMYGDIKAKTYIFAIFFVLLSYHIEEWIRKNRPKYKQKRKEQKAKREEEAREIKEMSDYILREEKRNKKLGV